MKNKDFRTAIRNYDATHGIDLVDGKGVVVMNFRTYKAARLYMDGMAKERARIIRENHEADLAYSRAYNAYWRGDRKDLPEKPKHKRPVGLVTIRAYEAGKAPMLNTAN